MCRNAVQLPAPSIIEASVMSAGTDWKCVRIQ